MSYYIKWKFINSLKSIIIMKTFNKIINLIKQNPTYNEILNQIEKKNYNLTIQNLYGSLKPLIIASLYEKILENKQNIVIITGNEREAEITYQDLKVFLNQKENIFHFPDIGVLPYE